MAFARSSLWIALAGCAPDAAEVQDDTAVLPACDPLVTWETAGEPYLRTWCASCHSADLQGADRAGAPEGVDFDTLAEVRARAERIEARVAADTMPPSTPPDGTDRDRFLAWLRCDLPE